MRRLLLLVGTVLGLSLPAAAAAQPTGRVLVLFDHARGARAQASAAEALAARTSARRAGPQVPEIGLVTVTPRPGLSVAALVRALRADPAVRSAQLEGRMQLRFGPNDPALYAAETAPGTPGGTPVQWNAGREGLFRAWDLTRGDGALVGVIDTGLDGSHPDLAGKIAAAADHGTGTPPTTDTNGHGTHVSSLACAAGGNGAGLVGAGLNCSLIVEKTSLEDASIAQSIVDATNRGALAINMSFGDSQPRPPVAAITAALDYAYQRGVVLVAAADDSPTEEQGQPANLLQPSGTGPQIDQGRGLSVTSSTFGDGPSGGGVGSQISLAAPGSFAPFSGGGGPPGLFGAFPANRTSLDTGSVLPPTPGCGCRTTFNGDDRYAYLQGTSMSAPQVAAIGALMRRLNGDASLPEVLRTIKQSARRASGAGWSPQLGWGILDAGAALDAVSRIDHRPPTSRLRAPTTTRARRFRIRWTGRDPAPAGLQASGVAFYEVYRAVNRGRYVRIARTRRSSIVVGARPGQRYRFFTVAVDRAGNREARPGRADASTRALRPSARRR